ncbi:MAG: type II toxin-antitoxin system PemK/MazF family toxin [Candidatus Peregrinibacteria bacterium]|nr:type II toxin-antitoxin system PemK/MazF family toxin [Candidatus Peregrinibacteria bacterium]
MKQREIYLINLNPTKGREQRGIRPAVIISGNTMNKNLGLCMVCPLSSKIKDYACCVALKKNKINNLDSDSEIITFQARTVAKDRLIKKIGEITAEDLSKVLEGLFRILKY